MSKTQRTFQIALLGLISIAFPAAGAGVEFASPVSYPVGTSPAGVVIADFNGDGKLDLAVANRGSGNVSILLGNGDGTFKAAVNSPAGPSPQSLAVGDFNGDHKLDLIVVDPGDLTNNKPGVVNLLLGNGDGSFRAPVQIHASQFPTSVAVGDFNNDQKLDIVIGDQSVETLGVILGKGDGTFQPAQTISLGGSGAVTSIVVADFNGDNRLDVVAAVNDAATPGNSGGRILLGNGDASFQTATQVANSNHGGYFLVGDFDADHRLDLALRFVVSPPPGCREFCISVDITNLYRGNGDGTFDSGNRVGLNGFGSLGGNIAAGDFNADSKLDLFAVGLFLGGGDGSFVSGPFDSSARGAFKAATDFNGDNLPDLAFTDTTSNAVVIVLNTSPTSGADLDLAPRGGQFIDEFVGSDVGFRATIFNEGPQDATGVTWTETLPAGWKFVSVQPSQGTCSGTTVITCELGALDEPSSATIDFGILLTTAGTFSDSQQVVGTQPDLNSRNNSASMTLTAVLPDDLSVSVSASKITGTVGDKITVSANVSNSGPATGTNVSLTDSFPDNFPISAITISQGACTTAPGNIACAIGTLAPGGNVTLSYVVTVQAAGVFAINLHVASDTPELVITNNDAFVTVTVTSPPDFTLGPAATSLTVQRGGQVNDVLTFPAQGGFSGTIVLTCSVSGPSPMPTCGISPASVTPGNNATLTVNASSLTASLIAPGFEQGARLYAAWLPLGLMACVLATGFDKKRRRLWALSLLMLAAPILPAACGDGNSVTRVPPPQNYTVTVTATSGAIQHSTPITVTVQ